MHRLVKSPQAEADLLDIWQFTFETWGDQQADRYLFSLNQGLERLTRAPRLGRPRDSIRPGYRSLSVGRHVIFYRIDGQTIDVIRVLHEKMDRNLQLGEDPEG